MLNLQVLNNVSRAMKYAQGTVLNDSADPQMLIILQGEAGIIASRPGGHHLAGRLGPGDFFGETSLFLATEKTDSLIALSDIIAIPVSRKTVTDFFRDEPAIAFEICKALCERMKGADEAAPTEVPTAQETSAQPSDFTLFPPEHGQYTLPIDNSDREHLLERTIKCPVCQQSFGCLHVRQSKLIVESTDIDMRLRYRGIEPLYYDVITCPHCFYSALSDMFNTAKKPGPGFQDELMSIRQSCGISFSDDVSTVSVFAGYYLSLLCAPQFFPKHQLVTAKLLLKLSRIYQDCGDPQLETRTAEQALDTYMYIYQNLEIPAEQEQQLCIIIAELSAKLGNSRQAKDFFFKIKIDRNAPPLLRRQAENRLFDIRESEK